MVRFLKYSVLVVGVVFFACQPAEEAVDQTADVKVDAATELALFNGQNIEGWKVVMENDEVPEQELVTAQAGVLTLHGQDHPKGVIRTLESYSDYELSFEWRWPGEPGNSGLLLHCDPAVEKATWPSCLESQLMNRGEKMSATSGYIALQFEKADIQFRQIQLKPLAAH